MSDDVKQCRNVQRVERILWGKRIVKRTFFARGVARHFAVYPYRPYFVMGEGIEQMQAGGGGPDL